MDIEASIIDQRVTALEATLRQRVADEIGVSDEHKLKSLTFVYLCVTTLLDLEIDEAFDCLVEGGGDFGVDAVHVSEPRDHEFTVTLFQGKYKKAGEGKSGFPATSLEKLVQAIRHLFDPSSTLSSINPRLRAKVEEIRSMIGGDALFPRVRVIACNNGLRWEANGEEVIRLAKFPADIVIWEHINHIEIVRLLQAAKRVSDKLQLRGKALVEDMNFSRVLVGRIEVEAIAALVEQHGDRLLERNVRRYLGLSGNLVNQAIAETLRSDRANFYFYNNGITMTCDKFSYNALQSGDYQVQVDNLQIINGGQTCMTIAKTLGSAAPTSGETASVLIRLYQLPTDNEDIVRRITYATNSQNPVDLRDLRANDDRQQKLELDVQELGYVYRRKRTDSAATSTDISSGTAAVAVLAVWRNRPHQAKFFSREHFGKLYDEIFSPNLTGAEVVLAVLLYRVAENRRRRPLPTDPAHVRYSSCFIAMQMGRRLLADLGARRITSRNFAGARERFESASETYFDLASDDITNALTALYGERDISLQQLSATFRRGELVGRLRSLASTAE